MPQPEISVADMAQAVSFAAASAAAQAYPNASYLAAQLHAAAARLREMQEFAQCTPGLGDCKTCPLCGAIHD